MIEMVCTKCSSSPTFNGMKELQEHIRSVHTLGQAQRPVPPIRAESPPPIVEVAPPVVEEPPKREPVVLEYKYKGECPTCGTQVTTLDVVLVDKKVMIAYCIPCNVKVTEQVVIPIEEQ